MLEVVHVPLAICGKRNGSDILRLQALGLGCRPFCCPRTGIQAHNCQRHSNSAAENGNSMLVKVNA